MTHGVNMHIEEFNKRFLNPWDRGEQRKTPCCNGQSWLLDNTQPGDKNILALSVKVCIIKTIRAKHNHGETVK